MGVFSTQIPNAIDQPLTDPKTGQATRAWFLFLVALFQRTGEAQGVDLLALQAETVTALANSIAALAAAATAQGGANASLKIIQNLADLANAATARTNLGLTALATAAPVAGWVDPTGAGSRATFDMNLALPAGAAYSQAEVTAIANQVIVLQKRLGQLVLDEKTVGTIST